MASSLSASSARTRVLSAYRRLFRARQTLFKGDAVALEQSKIAIKSEFVKHATAPTSGEHFEGLLSMVDEAEDMLLHGIVQGKLNPDSGHYEVKFRPEHAENMEDFSTVEPITNETVRKLKQQHEQQQENPSTTMQSSSCSLGNVVVEKTKASSK